MKYLYKILVGVMVVAVIAGSGVLLANDATAEVDCKEVGRLNGEVGYQYDATLTNNTDSKII